MEEKKIKCLISGNVRKIVKAMEEQGITKEDIVSLFPFEGQLYLIYFK